MGEEFGRLVKELCKKREISLRECARRSGVDVGYLCRSFKEGGSISWEAVFRLIDALQASPNEMLVAAGKLRKRFPYEALCPAAREACRKVAEGEELTQKDLDWLHHIWRTWRRDLK